MAHLATCPPQRNAARARLWFFTRQRQKPSLANNVAVDANDALVSACANDD